MFAADLCQCLGEFLQLFSSPGHRRHSVSNARMRSSNNAFGGLYTLLVGGILPNVKLRHLILKNFVRHLGPNRCDPLLR